MGLLALHPPRGWNRLGWLALAVFFIAAHILPHIPEISELRDFGMAMYAALAMWLIAVVALARTPRQATAGEALLPQLEDVVHASKTSLSVSVATRNSRLSPYFAPRLPSR
jgi:hypothetical protein